MPAYLHLSCLLTLKADFLMTQLLYLQDGALNQAPVITTYKAVSRASDRDREPQKASSTESVSSREEKRRSRNLASLKNIKQLSSSEDYVSLSHRYRFTVKFLNFGTRESLL